MPAKFIDERGIELAERLVHRGSEPFADVIGWLTQQNMERKKGATKG